jgi:hypothetical protein
MSNPESSEFEQIAAKTKTGFFRNYWQFLKENKK